ncbi:MAG: asparagine synthase (glutamine-hydrolyzing) [Bacillota bacterium]
MIFLCGITGFIDFSQSITMDQMTKIINNMTHSLAHRGPGQKVTWISLENRVALGHQRLSILDLSPTGSQPMTSPSGRYKLVLNGEIYNFRSLRQELEKQSFHLPIKFRSTADTEVALAAIEFWGLEKALANFTGMFAFALWDDQEKKLHLVRDRVGEKPLYYGWANQRFIFGSELKALTCDSGFLKEINRNALNHYLRLGYVPAPYTIYQNTYKLLPGTILTINKNNPRHPKLTSYWSMQDTITQGKERQFTGTPSEAISHLERLMRYAVKRQMIADVPVGAFLSGGIDSPLIVALMQEQSITPVRTFTLGFFDPKFNEADKARAISKHLGTDHYELFISPEEALKVIPYLPQVYDEPFADSSQIPTFLVAQLARTKVTVILSGDGGDELFGGYNRYLSNKKLFSALSHIPGVVRKSIRTNLARKTPEDWMNIFASLKGFYPQKFDKWFTGNRIYDLIELLKYETPEDFYLWKISCWKHPGTVLRKYDESPSPLNWQWQTTQIPAQQDFYELMMALDLTNYLPDNILVKMDRAAMHHSLETRTPLLDHSIVEFACQLPLNMKIQGNLGKWILREVLSKYIPQKLTQGPKRGFNVPVGDWLKGPLRSWAEALISEDRLIKEGYLEPGTIQEAWNLHISGRGNFEARLWNILMFQSWLEQQ